MIPAMDAPMAIGDNRLAWSELPDHVREAIAAAAGAPVLAVDSRPGGFSPSLACVLRLADGRAVFVKACGATRNRDTVRMHRREARVLAALPAAVPAPRLLWSYDDGEWVALMTEALDGANPAQPWRPDELAAFLAVAARLVEVLTPSPIQVPTMAAHFRAEFTGWRLLATDPDLPERLDPWTRRHLARLAEVEAYWPEAATGTSLLHGDLRADNVVLTRTGAMVVDWPSVCGGAGWVDLLLAVPSLVMHGAGDPQRLWRDYPPARRADPDAVTAVLVAVAGYFTHRSLLPEPAQFPTLRAFQRAQSRAALDWLRQRGF
jgi:aminoglycoside phosphotransferase (APT) family kinase protein